MATERDLLRRLRQQPIPTHGVVLLKVHWPSDTPVALDLETGMLTNGQEMYLLEPSGSDKRVLHPGKVIESSADAFAIVLAKPLNVAVGTEMLAFCDVRGKFFQQGAILIEIRADADKTVFAFNRSGEAISAENRQTFRVSVAIAEIYAQIGKQKKCHVVDFSPEGFGAIGSPGFDLGSLQKVSITYDQFSLSADARVQTIKVLPNGKVRYGFLVPKSNIAARITLQKLSASFQRTQLKRLAGAA